MIPQIWPLLIIGVALAVYGAERRRLMFSIAGAVLLLCCAGIIAQSGIPYVSGKEIQTNSTTNVTTETYVWDYWKDDTTDIVALLLAALGLYSLISPLAEESYAVKRS